MGNACQSQGSYCIGTGQACKYLECVGSSWRCPPDGGAFFDAGIDAADAAGTDATDARPESGNGDASAD